MRRNPLNFPLNATLTGLQTTYSAVFSRSSTLQLSRPLVFEAQVTSQTLVYRALHGTAPRYLAEEECYVADMPERGCVRSSTSSLLDVRPSRRATVADRSFATAASPRIWNGVPDNVTSATSLLTFQRKLKLHLFRQSYLDIIF